MTHTAAIYGKHQEKPTGLSLTPEELRQFDEQGYLGPYPLFGSELAKGLFDRCFAYPRLLLPWKKGRHAVVRELAQTALHPGIADRVASLLGEDVLLWGSILIRQPAAGKHPMHVDVEHAAWDGVSVWVGMQNVVSGQSFSVVSGSHKFATSPQQLHQGQELDCADDGAVLAAAQRLNPTSRLVYLDVKDGEFVIFSGRLWHGTKNTAKQVRASIVLQYTTPEQKVMIPRTYTMPQGTWSKRRPLCLLVRGRDRHGVNKVIGLDRVSGWAGLLRALFLYLPQNALESLKKRM